MKKLFSLLMLTAMVLLVSGFVSANGLTACTSETIVGGTIYQDVIANVVGGADVDVTCTHEGNPTTLSTTSLLNGAYSVVFDCTQCALNDAVEVHAEKDALTGDNSGAVDMRYALPCGVVVAGLTILSALGVFFLVRRK
jgi:hypothetical protein